MRRWHPLNRELCLSGRCHLPGLLLNAKGDRVAMHSSVETRYPFLDEEVFAFLAQVHPRWKLRGPARQVAAAAAGRALAAAGDRLAPQGACSARRSTASTSSTAPPFVDQLLSEESLRKTGYFDPEAVQHWRQALPAAAAPAAAAHVSIEMGLVGVLATQLWHQTFIDGSLADLPVVQSGEGASGER